MNPVRKYLLILFLFIAMTPVVAMLNYVFLKNAYEFQPINDAVNLQLNNGALYLPALHDTTYQYKLALYHKIKPKVVAVGSSRMFRIRGGYFNVPFVNLGGTMYNLREGKKLLTEMAATHKPEVILLGIDFWWFGDLKGAYNHANINVKGTEFQLSMVLLPCQWLLAGKISLPKFFHILLGRDHNPFLALGLHPAISWMGFYQDGSMFHYGLTYGLVKPSQKGFSPECEQINNGLGYFKYNCAINQKKWQEFASLLEFARNENIKVITYFLPFPARVVDLMAKKKGKYSYFEELRAKIPQVSENHFDFFDPREFGACDCEFFDGFHSGEIADLRMLRIMGRNPHSGLQPYLNWPKIEECIQQFSGKTLVPVHSFNVPYQEVDFLRLGCKKN